MQYWTLQASFEWTIESGLFESEHDIRKHSNGVKPLSIIVSICTFIIPCILTHTRNYSIFSSSDTFSSLEGHTNLPLRIKRSLSQSVSQASFPFRHNEARMSIYGNLDSLRQSGKSAVDIPNMVRWNRLKETWPNLDIGIFCLCEREVCKALLPTQFYSCFLLSTVSRLTFAIKRSKLEI